jgi:DNA-binding response OmpR family regulator
MPEKKILVIEDNIDIQKLLKRGLEANHFSVLQAFSGYEGLYKYLRHRPHLMILDVMMPGLSGYEVCREIRREINDLDTPIIMLTAKSEDYDRIKGKVIGATTYKTKPYDWEELLATIKEYLH